MKKRAVTLLLCLLLVVLSLLRGFAASAAGITPATNADFDVPCAAAILIDEDSGTVLYEKNADARRPIASITKVMTLLLAFEALEAGKIHLDDFVPVSEHAYHMGGSQIWLEPGEQMTLDDMLKAICISSANDAAVAVAEYVGGSETAFAEMMNVRAARRRAADAARGARHGGDSPAELRKPRTLPDAQGRGRHPGSRRRAARVAVCTRRGGGTGGPH